MDIYQGPAVVELDDGQKITVAANLMSTVDAMSKTDWSGTIQAGGQDQVRLLNVAQGRLHVGEQTGDFVVTSAGFGQLQIAGNGTPPPF